MSSTPEHLLSRYPPFALRGLAKHRRMQWSTRANAGLACAFAAAFTSAAYWEKTLVMPGQAVGLLEHPGIWLFLVAQVAIPWILNRSLRRFRNLHFDHTAPLSREFMSQEFASIEHRLVQSLERRTVRSRGVFDVIVFVGLLAWAWNTFQNQDPLKFLHFDFWDSSRHAINYWLTRFYKLYVLVMVGPALIHAQLCLVRAVRNMFDLAASRRAVILDPYHCDGDGGLTLIVNSVINPMVPIVLTSSLLTVAAFVVHGKYDITTIGGLAITVALLLLVYFVPALALRRAIADEKKRQEEYVCRIQREMYNELLLAEMGQRTLKDHTAALVSLADLAKRIDGISEWPQIRRIWRLAAVVVGSPLAGWGVKHLTVIAAPLFRL